MNQSVRIYKVMIVDKNDATLTYRRTYIPMNIENKQLSKQHTHPLDTQTVLRWYVVDVNMMTMNYDDHINVAIYGDAKIMLGIRHCSNVPMWVCTHAGPRCTNTNKPGRGFNFFNVCTTTWRSSWITTYCDWKKSEILIEIFNCA